MTDINRRDVLKGTLAGSAAVVALPTFTMASLPIPGLASLVTLEQLAAEGKYVSAELDLPWGQNDYAWEFSLDGQPMGAHTWIKEIYAPGDDTGWAILMKRMDDGKRNMYEADLVRGNWSIKRTRISSERT